MIKVIEFDGDFKIVCDDKELIVDIADMGTLKNILDNNYDRLYYEYMKKRAMTRIPELEKELNELRKYV